MDCFPPCKVCTGLCKQEAPVQAAYVPPRRVKPYRYPVPPYIKLDCGHFTDDTEQSAFRLLDTEHMISRAPRRKNPEYYCSKCEKWTTRKKPVVAELPEEPMF